MEGFATTDGVKIAYERRGEGPRIYVCHGGPANDHRYLADDLDSLTDRFEFVFWDYRGSGASDKADPSSYTLDRFAQDLDELRRQLADNAITVLAHSMGGFIALAFALNFPDDCERLILAGTWPSNDVRKTLPATFRALGAARLAKMTGRGLAWVAVDSWRRESIERRRRLYAIWSTMQEGRPEVRAAEAAREVELGLPLKNDNVRPLQRQFQSWDLSDRLGAVKCPALVLYGSRDAMAVAGAKTFAHQLPNIAERKLDEIGHDPFFEGIGSSGRAIESFLAG
jgi:proline iminopeptidase